MNKIGWPRRNLRILCYCVFTLVLIGIFTTELSDVENIVWTSVGAVINCTSYEREASRYLKVQVGLHEARNIKHKDVTLATQLSYDRLSALFRVIKQWDGFVSAAIYVTEGQLKLLNANLTSQETGFLARTDIHVVINDGGLYPINFLRNVALNHTRTNFIFLSDVDFIPVPGLNKYLKRNIGNGLLSHKQALIVPAFTFIENSNVIEYPDNKEKLIEMLNINVNTLCSVSFSKKPSQCPTDYDTWISASKPYVVKYHRGFEPYIVMRQSETPPYNEGFVGRELDKVSHLLEVHAKGYKFVVLPDVYTIHYPHPKLNVTGSNYWCPRRHFVNFEGQLRHKYGNF